METTRLTASEFVEKIYAATRWTVKYDEFKPGLGYVLYVDDEGKNSWFLSPILFELDTTEYLWFIGKLELLAEDPHTSISKRDM